MESMDTGASPRRGRWSPGSWILLLLAVLVLLAGNGCQGSVPLRKTGELGGRSLMEHPQLERVARQLMDAARGALASGQAPDAAERWMVTPVVVGDGAWEASVVCRDLLAEAGRVQPVQLHGSYSSAEEIQDALRAADSPACVWLVTSRGRGLQRLDLTICSARRKWSSSPVEVSIALDEKKMWPFDPAENPPLARVEAGRAERFFTWRDRLYVENRQGARELRWHRGKRELSLGVLRPWKDFGRTWVTRNVGIPDDPTPAVALLRRNIRLELRDLDLPRGEGEVVQWFLGRGGSTMELPLRKASAVEIIGIEAAPAGWNERGTWLVLRDAPGRGATVEIYAASLRQLPRPPEREKSSPPDTVRVLCDLTRPFTLPGLDGAMKVTHELRPIGPDLPATWHVFALWSPLFDWLSPLEFWRKGDEALDAVRQGRLVPPMHVVRPSPLDEAWPRWIASSARGPLALGDRAFWRRVPAAPLYGVARIDPEMPAPRRRALAAWLSRLGPFELFGLRREELAPRLPLSGRPRPRKGGPEAAPPLGAGQDSSLAGLELEVAFDGCAGLLDPLGERWRRTLQRNLRARMDAAGMVVAFRGEATDGGDSARSASCPEWAGGGLDLARLVLPPLPPQRRAEALLESLGLLEPWAAAGGGDDPRAVEEWLLGEGYLVPMWTEPGAVFVDRRMAHLVADSLMVLPDLREAVLLPTEVFTRFDLRR